MANWQSHKKNCIAVRKNREAFDSKQEFVDFLRNSEHGGPNYAQLYQPGSYLHVSYTSLRFTLAKSLQKIKTYAAVSNAHEHLVELMRIDKSDAADARFLLSFVKLRLGKDQECYDFIAWWITAGHDLALLHVSSFPNLVRGRASGERGLCWELTFKAQEYVRDTVSEMTIGALRFQACPLISFEGFLRAYVLSHDDTSLKP